MIIISGPMHRILQNSYNNADVEESHQSDTTHIFLEASQ